jgi:hypothetical protein
MLEVYRVHFSDTSLFPARQGPYKPRNFLEVFFIHVWVSGHLRRTNCFAIDDAVADVLEVFELDVLNHAFTKATFAVVVAANAIVAFKHLATLRMQRGRSGQVLRFTVTACKSHERERDEQ